MISMSLDSKNCKELVLKEWNENFIKKLSTQGINSDILSLAKNIKMKDLIAACPQNDSLKLASNIVGAWKKRSNQGFKNVIKQKCLACHAKEIDYQKETVIRKYYDENYKIVKQDSIIKSFKLPAIDLENIDYKLALKFQNAIFNPNPKKRMPKIGALKKNEEKLFLEYLQKKELELPSDYSAESDEPFVVMKLYSNKAVEEHIEKKLLAINDALKEMDSVRREYIKGYVTKSARCDLQQTGCKELIAERVDKKREEYTQEGPGLTEEKLKLIKKYELSLKCKYSYQVTVELCKGVEPLGDIEL